MEPLTMLLLGGTAMQAMAAGDAAESALYRGKIQQALNEVAAGQVVASGQRRALEQTRQAEIMAKRALAVAAAGGHAGDVNRLIADISGEGVYRAGVALYEAETEAEQLKLSGKYAAEEGEEKFRAGKTQQLATILSGAGTMMAYSRQPKMDSGIVEGDAYQPARRYG